jgi:YesN/AraC family two-component response regulator
MSTAEKSMSTKIRIILADDHAVVRDGIVAVIQRLAENITIVGEAATGKEVIELAQDKAVDVFVLDVEMPES